MMRYASGNDAMTIEASDYVDEVMRRWPATIRAFLDHRMHCVGCPIGCFHTVEEACREHGVELPVFLAALHALAVDPRRESCGCGCVS